MSIIPQIRLCFILTKNDSSDFDRWDVTRRLKITPSETSAPLLSKGKVFCDIDDSNDTDDLTGLTILKSSSPPYKMIKHAFWSVKFPKTECWELEYLLKNMEQLFCGKESDIRSVCEDYDLSADLIVRVFSESNAMPDLTISANSLAFWATMSASIGFDFYLD